MKLFSKTFNIAIAILITISPVLYEQITDNNTMNNIYFNYTCDRNCIPMLLEQNYIINSDVEEVIKKYLGNVESSFKNKNYSVSTVMKQDKAQTPITEATDLIYEIFVELKRLDNKKRLAIFRLTNNTNAPITLSKVLITTDDAYENPIFGVYSTVATNSKPKITFLNKQSRGYLIGFQGGILMPGHNNSISVIIAFDYEPEIKFESSFIEFQLNGKNQTMNLQDSTDRSEFSNPYRIYFIIVAIFAIYGLSNIISIVVKFVKQKTKKYVSKQSSVPDNVTKEEICAEDNESEVIPPVPFIDIPKDDVNIDTNTDCFEYNINQKIEKKIRIVRTNLN